MAIRRVRTAQVMSPEEFDVRSKLAKALWIVEQGDDRTKDPEKLQSEFDAVKNEWIAHAVKVKKTLSFLGYELKKS